jgi:hypothetical protein
MRYYTTFRLIVFIFSISLLSACSMDKMMVRASMPMIEGGIEAMNSETDLQLAEDSMPANLSMLNGMINLDPENVQLHVYAAQAYYGLSFGFTEDTDKKRSEQFYLRGLKHGLIALQLSGLGNAKKLNPLDLEEQLQKMDKDDVPALFWTASNWAKWIDLNRFSPASLIELPKPTAMMQRVLELDETFYFGGAHIYFGVLYGARAPSLGGDFKKSAQHFDRAREITDNKLLIADLIQAQYLSRQMNDRNDFHQRLTKIINAPDDLYPEAALINKIAKKKAKQLIRYEDKWF